MRRRCPTSAGPRNKWPCRPLPWLCSLSPPLRSTVPSSGRLLCQRAELHMDMRNFSLAVQDASSLCRLKPHWTKVRLHRRIESVYLCCKNVIFLLFFTFQARCLKATALSNAGRNDEALQEYFLCVALKPDWTKVKLEAQKVHYFSWVYILPETIFCSTLTSCFSFSFLRS